MKVGSWIAEIAVIAVEHILRTSQVEHLRIMVDAGLLTGSEQVILGALEHLRVGPTRYQSAGECSPRASERPFGALERVRAHFAHLRLQERAGGATLGASCETSSNGKNRC